VNLPRVGHLSAIPVALGHIAGRQLRQVIGGGDPHSTAPKPVRTRPAAQ
jgi:hypothetical protein